MTEFGLSSYSITYCEIALGRMFIPVLHMRKLRLINNYVMSPTPCQDIVKGIRIGFWPQFNRRDAYIPIFSAGGKYYNRDIKAQEE